VDEVSDIPQSESALDRRMVAHDLWPRRLIERRAGEDPTLPARVWWPRSTEEVQALVTRAREEDRALVPFGAGSGVCAGVSPDRRAWILDLKRMGRVLELDEARALVTVEAGMIGERLERWLNARGWSLGHFPSSIYCSTVGGWVAARSAGQLSSRYGKIEDLLFGFEAVDGTGRVLNARLDDPATGPGALRLLVGSEGGLCVFTTLTFRVHKLATHRWLRGFVFPELEPALAGMRGLFARGEPPSVLRLYDPLDTWLAGAPPEARDEPDHVQAGGIACAGLENSGPNHDDDDEGFLDQIKDHVDRLALFRKPRVTRELIGELLSRPLLVNTALDRARGASKLIVGIEGDAADVAKRAERIRRHLSVAGGVDAGEAPGVKWLLHRHRVSYKMARAFAAGGWVDTMEVATGWEGVIPLYREVRRALRDVAVVMCHFSHAYLDGCSLYFTFAGGGRDTDGPRSSSARYDLAWSRALASVRAHGACISHHHGVGRSKRDALRRDGATRALLGELKAELDPDDVLNPGVLGIGKDRA
jgi:alkyldihydroxyacetonephosphate synthase